MNGVSQGAGILFLPGVSTILFIPGVQNFAYIWSFFHEGGEFCKIHKFGEIHKIHEVCETRRFCNHCSGTGHAIGHEAVRRTVLCITCFAYSLLVVLVFPLLSY